MPEAITVRIIDVVGSSLAVSAEDGQAVHDKIAPVMREGQAVGLSFQGIDTVISAFLNAAIGQLYGEFPEEKIRELFSVKDMAPEDVALLKRVVENAKSYFRDPDRFRQIITEVTGDEE